MNYQLICDTLNRSKKGERVTMKSIRDALESTGEAKAKRIMMQLVYAGLIDRKQSCVNKYFKKDELAVGKVRMVLEEG